MNTTQHTLGPWIKDRNMIRTKNGCEIARVSYDQSGYVQANTRLISAAPDLLEACKEIESLPIDDNGERTIPAGFLDTLRAAVAKAEGKGPQS